MFVGSSEADYEDFESIEQDEIIHSDCCSDENGKIFLSHDDMYKYECYRMLYRNGHEYQLCVK